MTDSMWIEPEITALQEWEGYIVDMEGDELVARLVDLTAGSTHEEEVVVIPLAEFSECDAATVRVGSIFRWVIGYERSPSGAKKRVSQIVLRDLRMTVTSGRARVGDDADVRGDGSRPPWTVQGDVPRSRGESVSPFRRLNEPTIEFFPGLVPSKRPRRRRGRHPLGRR